MKYQVICNTSEKSITKDANTFKDAKAILDKWVKDSENSAWFNNDHLYMRKVSDVYYKIIDRSRTVMCLYIKKV